MNDEDGQGADQETVEVDLCPWGKSRGLGDNARYPLICHLLDAGAAARHLWEHYIPAGVHEFIADGFGVSAEHAGRLVALWAALHDIGKLVPEFQALDKQARLPGYPPSRGLHPAHDASGQKWLQATLPELGYTAGDTGLPGYLVPQLLGGHHGSFHLTDESGPRTTLRGAGFSDDQWEQQRRAMLTMVRRIVGDPGPPPESSLQAAALTCPIIILADWLVSQDSHLLDRMTRLPAKGTADELRAHFEESLSVSARLAEKAGLTQLRLRPGDFASSFPRLTKPNELQKSVSDRLPYLVHGPGLLLVTAPPGLGKTETALYGSKIMGEKTGRTGVYLGLPTMATADQMYLRVRDFLRAQAGTKAALMLLHGMAWLNTQYQPDTDPAQVITGDDHDEGSFLPTEWLLGRHRGMCGAWAVGTIDQALMAALKGKFNALRLFGLAGKTVIIDEVHACDPYMQGLLRQLLRWLGSFGTPVVLLSATLTTRAASALVSAYLEGAGSRRPRCSSERIMAPGYPGWLYADARTGSVETASVRLPPVRPLQVSTREIHASPEADGGRTAPDRIAALRTELAPLTGSGGCALVICTTVDEAQQTYLQLSEWFGELSAAGERPPDLALLHARYPAWQRKQITDQVMARFGKNEDGSRPTSAVLVATAIVEQSLDLDFDLIVSDLAPVALLIQRAGRCWRHEALGTIRRPAWASAPRLTVLVPTGGPGSPELFRSWKAVYDESLLTATYRLLADHDQIRIPDDVQQFVDDVYEDPALVTGIESAVTARLGDEIARRELAQMVTIPAPQSADSLADLTDTDLTDPEMLATRFDADSVRALPVFADPDGCLWLDRSFRVILPGQDGDPGAEMSEEDYCTIVDHTVPVRGGHWLKEHDAKSALPKPWHHNVHLRDLILLVHNQAPDGSVVTAVIGDQKFHLDDVLGLTAARKTLAGQEPTCDLDSQGSKIGHVRIGTAGGRSLPAPPPAAPRLPPRS